MHMYLQLDFLLLLVKTVIAPFPDCMATLQNIGNGQRNALIELYFHRSFTSMEIVGALLPLHGILYGKITGHQQIESLWGILHKQCVNF